MESNSPLLNYKIFNSASEHHSKYPPLVILHGLLGSMDNWRSQAKRFSESRIVITMDLRNHGDSPHIKGMSYREMCLDVIGVLQKEKIQHFDLLGHSMGGKVAMQLALTHSQSVNRLIVVDIAPKSYPLWHQNILKALIETPLHDMKSRKQIDDYLSSKIEDQTDRNFMLKNLKRTSHANRENNNGGLYQWRCNIAEIAKGYLKIASFNPGTLQFEGETLFIRGGNSTYIEPTDISKIHSYFPQATIETIIASGHLPHFEEPDVFFTKAKDFLNRMY